MTKRKQVKNACTNCQKACKKCDDERPCTRCVKYGMEGLCVNSQRKERRKGVKRGPYQRSGSGKDDVGEWTFVDDRPVRAAAQKPVNYAEKYAEDSDADADEYDGEHGDGNQAELTKQSTKHHRSLSHKNEPVQEKHFNSTENILPFPHFALFKFVQSLGRGERLGGDQMKIDNLAFICTQLINEEQEETFAVSTENRPLTPQNSHCLDQKQISTPPQTPPPNTKTMGMLFSPTPQPPFITRYRGNFE